VDLDQLGPVNNDDGAMLDNGDGTFTATTGGTTFPTGAFPAGATLRAVGLQGYFQVDVDADGASDYSLHTPSAVIAATDDAARREVVDSNKCGNCHEWFEGHGGSRTFNMQVCIFCHNPNLSSSGREIAAPSDAVKAVYGDNALSYPEATNNFKDMIHGIHGGENRTTDYEFVRNRNNGIPYDWSEVTFPGRSNNCLTCHKPGTYGLPLAENTLLTTNRTTGVANGMDATVAAVSEAQNSVPNDTDWVITPTAAVCYACHDSGMAKAHMKQNGALINENRSAVVNSDSVESCAICHGADKTADLNEVHGM
jgi:OmcA/MtrC family decaheme c-type cytochrome